MRRGRDKVIPANHRHTSRATMDPETGGVYAYCYQDCCSERRLGRTEILRASDPMIALDYCVCGETAGVEIVA